MKCKLYIEYNANLRAKKIYSPSPSRQFLSPEFILHIYKSIIHSYFEYRCRIMSGTSSIRLYIPVEEGTDFYWS